MDRMRTETLNSHGISVKAVMVHLGRSALLARRVAKMDMCRL